MKVLTAPKSLPPAQRPWWDPFGELRGWLSRERAFVPGARRAQIPLPPGWCTSEGRVGQAVPPPLEPFAQRLAAFDPVWRWDFRGDLCGHPVNLSRFAGLPVVHDGVQVGAPSFGRRPLANAPLEAEMPLVPAEGETPGLYGPFTVDRRHQACGFDQVWILADLEPVVTLLFDRRRAWVDTPDKPFDPSPVLALEERLDPEEGTRYRDIRPAGSRFLGRDQVAELPAVLTIIPSRLDAATGERVYDAYQVDLEALDPSRRRHWARRAAGQGPARAPLDWAAWHLGGARDFLLDVLHGRGGVLARMREDVHQLLGRYRRGWLPPDLEIFRDWIRDMRQGGWAKAQSARMAYAERKGMPVVFDPALANEGPARELLGGDRWMSATPGNRWFLRKELGLDDGMIPLRDPKVLEDLWRRYAARELTTPPDVIAAALWRHNYSLTRRQRGLKGLLRREGNALIAWDDTSLYLETSPFGTQRLVKALETALLQDPRRSLYGPRVPECLRRSFVSNFIAGTLLDLKNLFRLPHVALWAVGGAWRTVGQPVTDAVEASGAVRILGRAGRLVAIGLGLLIVGLILVLVPAVMILAQ